PLGRSVEEAMRMVDALIFHETHGDVCPANWKDGDDAMKPTAEDLISSQKTQLELLHTAAVLLKPDRVLVYATCSLESEENQQVVEQFLAAHPAFALTDCRDFLPASARSLVDEQGFFAPLPTEEIEGFFAARLVRRSL
ncbi:MAG: hypothetical protein D3912_15720, partial [Candidatus Electrothrix sp. AX1]|nr:hypothetical protein [Candidatus Electrothrix sp. AX1]